jgi:exosortase
MNQVDATRSTVRRTLAVIAAGPLIVSLLWAYWPTLAQLERTWAHDPRYSHGYLVPFFSLYVLWMRRHLLSSQPCSGGWIGVLILCSAATLRALGAYIYFAWLDAVSLLISVAGFCWLLGGKPAWRWAWPSIAFLIFMVPLPFRVETNLGAPLQRLATLSGTYLLQVFGLPALSSGNTIVIDDYTIGIVDACNGLGASYMVLACACGAVAISHRPFPDKLILIVSSIPIALLANTTRITLTGLFHGLLDESGAAGTFSHDLAGWVTLPLSLAALYIESRLLSLLIIELPDANFVTVEPIDNRPALVKPAVPDMRESRVFPIVVAICTLLATGLVHGFRTNRWGLSSELELASFRVEGLPMTVGNWKGTPATLDRREMLAAGLDGFVLRTYKNEATGKSLTLLLVCGRPGPVSVHTPEICYPGAGYEIVQAHPVKIQVGAESGGDFVMADFERRETIPADRLRIYWSWNASGTWSVPESPRIVFAPHPVVYKLYLISAVTKYREQSTEDGMADFLGQLLPELRAVLFPGSVSR